MGVAGRLGHLGQNLPPPPPQTSPLNPSVQSNTDIAHIHMPSNTDRYITSHTVKLTAATPMVKREHSKTQLSPPTIH